MGKCAAAPDVTQVWDLGVRLFHWLLVAAVAIALVTGLSGPRNVLNIHIGAGAAMSVSSPFAFSGALWVRPMRGFFPFPFSSPRSTPTSSACDRRRRDTGTRSAWQPDGAYAPGDSHFSVMTGVVTLGGVDKQGPLAFVTSYNAGKATQGLPRRSLTVSSS